ncbi:MAG TPA: acetylxylan esterase [Flavitalea sp.]|nr:acetylxylan esterase [Flavitalea sp.]
MYIILTFSLWIHGFTSPCLSIADTLPKALSENHSDLIDIRLRNEAYQRFAEHQVPSSKEEWEKKKKQIRKQVIDKSGIVSDHSLPLNLKETGVIIQKGFTIHKIIFQTRPGVYATASLYVPDGNGPFPGVINMNGHWPEARMSESVQSVSITLARNGYVCLAIDAFGAGERASVHGTYEYHGGNLGASLMNVGESLLGFQVSDNMRGIDLLVSLPYVDRVNIGATGASGGGNQTMWLTAIDERIKASMPVVSIGNFEVYVMNDNCICELPIDALTFTEESGILGLIAPRAIKICNHKKDDIPAFFPPQMLRTYNNVRPLYKLLGHEENIAYQLFDSTHGYWQGDREAMLGWFNLHLKGTGDGNPAKEEPVTIMKDEQLMVFPKGQRDSSVVTIAGYCIRKGNQLKKKFLSENKINVEQKKNQLRLVLRVKEKPAVTKVIQHTAIEGWKRFALQTTEGKLIPVIVSSPDKSNRYVIICDPRGKDSIPENVIRKYREEGKGIVMVDLSGTGEATSPAADVMEGDMKFHTLSRADLLLGKTVLGEWVNELDAVTKFIKMKFSASTIDLDGKKETGLAALFFAALNNGTNNIVLRDVPVSYLFDTQQTINFYNMSVHLPGFLNWGDVSLAVALTGKSVEFNNALTMSGRIPDENQMKAYKDEYKKVQRACGKTGRVDFVRQ